MNKNHVWLALLLSFLVVKPFNFFPWWFNFSSNIFRSVISSFVVKGKAEPTRTEEIN